MLKINKDIVLFVDDEDHILHALKRATIDEEFTCKFALGGQEALDILAEEPISVLVTDMRMPEIDGLHLLKIVKERYPNTIRIVLSGFAQMQQILTTVNQAEIFKFLLKPWNQDDELLPVLRQAVALHRMNADRLEMEHSLKQQNEAYESIMKRINQVVLAAKSNSSIFSAFANKAFEAAISAIDHPEDAGVKKQQLLIASKLLHELTKTEFEEYKEIKVTTICSAIASSLKANKKASEMSVVGDVRPEEKIMIRESLLTQILVVIVNVLTAFCSQYSVKIKTEMETADGQKRLKLLLAISQVFSRPENIQPLLQSYMDTMNLFVAQAFCMIGGDFECVLSNNLVIVKIMVKDVTIDLQALG
ncbi:MAG: response regulator [Eubacteriales bacterium]